MRNVLGMLKILLSIVILLTLIVFAYNNRYNMHLDLSPIASAVRIPAYAVIYIAFIIGMISSVLLHWIFSSKLLKKAKMPATKEDTSTNNAEVSNQDPMIGI